MWEKASPFKRVNPQVEHMDGCETPELAPPLQTPSCDLLSHTVGRPEALLPEGQEQRGKLMMSDRKLSLQERSQSAASPCGSPGLNGRYIYPSLPYSPITSPHSSPRLPRRPTVESHSVSITDLQVWLGLEAGLVKTCHMTNDIHFMIHIIVEILGESDGLVNKRRTAGS